MTAENQDLSGFSMMDLFRGEAETQTGILNEGLLEIEKDPTSKQWLERLMRAAHSVKGAARIVGLTQVVKVAHALEDCFVAAQKGQIVIGPDQTDILLKGVDTLTQMSKLSDKEFEKWISDRQADIESLLVGLETLKTTGMILPKEAPAIPPVPKVEKPAVAPPPTGATKAAQDSGVRAPAENQNLSGFSMMDLFRSEAETQTGILNEGLLEIEKDPASKQWLERLMRAAHSVKGAARIVGLTQVVKVAHALEDCFVAAQKGQIVIGPDQTDILLKGVDTLTQMSKLLDKEFEKWISDRQADIESLLAGLEALKTTGMILPKEAPAIPPVPKVEKPAVAPPPTGATKAAQDSGVRAPAENQNLSGFSMMDLFRSEAETQTGILNEGLLEIEKDPTSKQWLERLMRAAHSVKGAARIVGLTQVVKVAHALEDCFVAAQKGQIVIGPDQTDILLKGVDTLTQMSKLLDKEFEKWISGRQADIESLLAGLEALKTTGLISPKEAPAISPVPKVEPPADAPAAVLPPSEAPAKTATASAKPAPPPGAAEAAQGRGVRVSAENLSRMMGLAGESAVQAHRLEAFAAALTGLKSRHAELLRLMKAAGRSRQNLSLSGQALQEMLQKTETFHQLTTQRVEEFDLIARQLTDVADRLYRETIASRMRPFADGITGFPRLIRDLSKQLGKKIKFEVIGKNTQVDRDILANLEAPLTHFLQNSVDHGIEPPAERLAAGKSAEAVVKLEARHRAGRLTITVSDDGRGMDVERLRDKIVKKGLATQDTVARLSETEVLDFIFLPGFSTADNVTEVSGRGVGLDVVQNFLHEVGGTVHVENNFGRGVRFQLEMPVTRSVMRALVVEVAGDPYAFPLGRIERLAEATASEVKTIEGRQYTTLDEKNVGLIDARQVLGLTGQAAPGEKWPIVVISNEETSYGIKVDRFLGERELVVRTLDARLGKVQDLSAVSLMEDGSPVFILDVEDLQRSIQNLLSGRKLEKIRSGVLGRKKQKRILVVDDSITVREMERRLLQNRGYEVEVAVDGVDGWNSVYSGQYELVISDVDMPRMNGFDLVRRIRQDSRLSALPVMMVSYKERQEDRIRGLEAGANYYFTKGGFHDEAFMRAVVDLIGEA